MFNSDIKSKENHKYGYIPDISLIMEQIGAKLTLLDILNENPTPPSNAENRSDYLYYHPDDINGRFV